MPLKGLTAADRAAWEKRYNSYIQGLTPEQVDRVYMNTNFDNKYKGRSDYDSLRNLSYAQKEAFWNQEYDRAKAKVQSIQFPTDSSILQTDTFVAPSDATSMRAPIELEYEQRTTPAISRPREYASDSFVRDSFKDKSEEYQNLLQRYDAVYERNYPKQRDDIANLKSRAYSVSNWYKKYGHTDYVQFDDDEWKELTKQYNAARDLGGDEYADEFLRKAIYNEVQSNTSWLENQWRGFQGMGASAFEDIGVLLTALPTGVGELIFTDDHNIEGASWWTKFIDAVVDNRSTRYFHDVKQYGTFSPERIEQNKKLGISDIQIMDDYDVLTGDASFGESIFNENLFAHLLDQYGFTAATLFMGGVAKKATNWAFKGYKGWRMSQITGETAANANRLRQTLTRIQKVENVADRVLIPGMLGQGEAIIESMETKNSIMEEGQAMIDEKQSEAVNKEFQRLVGENYDALFKIYSNPEYTGGVQLTEDMINSRIIDELWEQAWKNSQEKYADALAQLNYDAARGARTNFMMNSAINGLLNTTLKASLFNNNTASRFYSSKLGKLFKSKGKINVDASGKATGKLPWWSKVYTAVEESVGEGIEEMAQYVSDKASQGKAFNNLQTFVDYKYGSLPQLQDVNVGQIFWEDYAAMATAAGEAFADKEMYINGTYGFLSSMVGGVARPGRARLANGKEGRILQRGVKANGEQEKWYDIMRRVTPWRSGLSQGIQRANAIEKDIQNQAEVMQAWLDNPENRAKFDGANGTIRWASAMQGNAEAGDNFGFRNSAKGKAINDAIMLQKLKGTDYYNAWMEQVNTARTLSSQPKEVQQAYVNEVRTSQAVDTENMSDEELVAQIEKNANQMMSDYEAVQKQGDKLENLLGEIDDDTKESLIYGQMMIDDFKERGEQIESDLRSIRIDNPVSTEVDTAEESDNAPAPKVLSEAEIMNLDPVKRSELLSEPAEKHSPQQQKVIDNLIAQATTQDEEFMGKINDAARLVRETVAYSKDYAKVLADPDGFADIYARNAKVAAMKATYKKKYDELASTQDYQEFATKMDNLIASGNAFEVNTILSQMEKDAQSNPEETNFSRYLKSREDVANILMHATTKGRLSELDGNDIQNFTNAISYLTHKGVDIHNGDAVTEAMLETDANGNNLFTEYARTIVDSQEDMPDSPEEVITLVHDVLASYDKDIAEQEWKSAPVAVVKDPQQAPVVSQSPAVSPTASASLETNGNDLSESGAGTVTANTTVDESGNTVEVSVDEQQAKPVVSEDSAVADFVDKYPDDVIQAALRMEEFIKKSNMTDEEKGTALSTLAGLSESQLETVEDLVNAFRAEANKLDIQSDTNTADAMRKISERVLLAYREQEAKKKRDQDLATATDLSKMRELTGKSPLAFKMLRFATEGVNRDAASMRTLAINGTDPRTGEKGLKERFSTNPDDPNYSPLLNYLETHKVEQFLLENDITRDEPVYFICDPVLVQEQQRVWKEHGITEYSKSNIPIIACIKSPKGTVTIGGETYQPIGIMPKTGSTMHTGSNRLERVREYIDETGDTPFIISDSQGPIETRLSNHIYANPPKQLYKNIGYLDAKVNELSADDRALWNNTSLESRKTSPIYRAIKKNFLDLVTSVKLGKDRTRTALVVSVDNKKDRTIPLEIFIPEVTTTKGVGMAKTVGEMFTEGDTSVMTANSRLHRWSNELKKFIAGINEEAVVTMPDGTVMPNSERELAKMSEQLDTQLGRFLHIPGYKIQIKAGNLVNGKRDFIITATDELEDTIILGTVQKGTLTDEEVFTMAKNLIFDENGNVRTNNSGNELVKWQVDYAQFGEQKNSSISKDNISKMFDDGIFEVSKDRINYSITGLTIEAPYTNEGVRRVFEAKKITESSNASTPTDAPLATSQVTSGNVVIDTNTGTIVSGNTKAGSLTDVEEAKRKADEIGKETYTQDSMGTYTKYGRDHNNPYVGNSAEQARPENIIKQQVMELFRHLVYGRSYDGNNIIHNMLNMTEKAFNNFEAQVNAWKNGITADGITLLPKEVLATWHTEGKNFAMPIGLGYDAQGNWKVFVPVVGKATKADHQMLSMLSQSIEKEYGIKISDFNFVELSAQMPKGNNMIVDNLGQIITNKSHRYDGARPMMSGMNTVKASDITTYQDAVDMLSERLETPLDEVKAPDVTHEDEYNDGLFEDVDMSGDLGDTSYVPASQEWGVFAGRGLNAKKTVAALEAAGITEEEWILMSEPEREQELTCKGVF